MSKDEAIICECGCAETLVWSGSGRRPHYVNEAHKQAAYRNRNRLSVTKVKLKVMTDDTVTLTMALKPATAQSLVAALKANHDYNRLQLVAASAIQRLIGD